MKTKNVLKKRKIAIIITIIILGIALLLSSNVFNKNENLVKIETSMGNIVIELNPEAAPITVKNFKDYVNQGFYDGLVFHRVIDGFMIQGGGFDETGKQKKTRAPIKLEVNNGLSNEEYTIAMARTQILDSATSQFFINSNNNKFLDTSGGGYAVFGKVIKGQNVVDRIEKVQTTNKNGMSDWPVKEIVIEKISLI